MDVLAGIFRDVIPIHAHDQYLAYFLRQAHPSDLLIDPITAFYIGCWCLRRDLCRYR